MHERRLGRRDEARVVRSQRAGNRREQRRDHEHAQLDACAVYAQSLRSDLGAVQGAQRTPLRRLEQVQRQPHGEQQARAGNAIPGRFALKDPAEQHEGCHRHAVGAAGDTVFRRQHDRDDDPQAQRGHRQRVALQAQGRAADDEGKQTHRRASRQQRQGGGPAVAAGEDRRAVAAQRKEAGVAKADLAGIADQQVQADAHDCVQRHDDRNIVGVVVGQQQRQQGNHRGQCEHAAGARPRGPAPRAPKPRPSPRPAARSGLDRHEGAGPWGRHRRCRGAVISRHGHCGVRQGGLPA